MIKTLLIGVGLILLLWMAGWSLIDESRLHYSPGPNESALAHEVGGSSRSVELGAEGHGLETSEFVGSDGADGEGPLPIVRVLGVRGVPASGVSVSWYRRADGGDDWTATVGNQIQPVPRGTPDFGARTDDQGEVRWPPAWRTGRWTLVAEAGDHQAQLEWDFASTKKSRFQLDTGKMESQPILQLCLQSTHDLNVRVLDEMGEPVASAIVVVCGLEPKRLSELAPTSVEDNVFDSFRTGPDGRAAIRLGRRGWIPADPGHATRVRLQVLKLGSVIRSYQDVELVGLEDEVVLDTFGMCRVVVKLQGGLATVRAPSRIEFWEGTHSDIDLVWMNSGLSASLDAFAHRILSSWTAELQRAETALAIFARGSLLNWALDCPGRMRTLGRWAIPDAAHATLELQAGAASRQFTLEARDPTGVPLSRKWFRTNLRESGGRAEFDSASGLWTLSVPPAFEEPVQFWAKGAGYARGKDRLLATVQLPEGEQSGGVHLGRIELAAPPVLAFGHVMDVTGKPLAGQRLSMALGATLPTTGEKVHSVEFDLEQVETSERGEFEIRAWIPTSISGKGLISEWTWTVEAAGVQWVRSRTVFDPERPMELRLDRTGGLAASVRIGASLLPHVQATLWGNGLSRARQLDPKSLGELIIDGLAPGAYGFEIRLAGTPIHRWIDLVVTSGEILQSGISVDLHEGDGCRFVDVLVLSEDAVPVRNAEVRARYPEGKGFTVGGPGFRTDAQGRARVLVLDREGLRIEVEGAVRSVSGTVLGYDTEVLDFPFFPLTVYLGGKK